MMPKQFTNSALKWVASSFGLVAVSYGAYVAVTWFHYGKAKPASGRDSDPLLDKFMPRYEIADRHKTFVAAPADVTLAAATEVDLEDSPLVRGVFKGREWILRSKSANKVQSRGLLAQTKMLGWGTLAEVPGREIVMGCATKPWEPNPVFRALPPDEFAAFQEPGYVKIVWTLRADPIRNGASIFRTETRAIATDPTAFRKFRRYWSLLSPGIILIRTALLPGVKRGAEHRKSAAASKIAAD